MKSLGETPNRFYRPWILSALSGLILASTFPRPGLSLLAWFAFLPVFFALRNVSPALALRYGFMAGLCFYTPGLGWVTNTMTRYGNLPESVSFGLLLLLAAYLSL